LLDIISKNISQGIPDINIIRNITVTPDILYTCPPGKKAIVKGIVRCVDRGTAAQGRFIAKGVILYRWDRNTFQTTTLHPAWSERPDTMSTNSGGEFAVIDLVLEAGENITVAGNTGVNSQFKTNLQVRELLA